MKLVTLGRLSLLDFNRTTKCDPIHNTYNYEFGHTLLNIYVGLKQDNKV
jgi:hypothetical protein